MAYSSLIVEAFAKSQKKVQAQPRYGTRSPVQHGVARGALGSTGANPFQARNSDAGEQKERRIMQSPIFQAFIQKMVPQTPVSNFLRRLG